MLDDNGPRAVAPRHTRLTVNLVLRRVGLVDLMDIDPSPDRGLGIGGRDHFVVTPVPNRDFRPFPLPSRRLTHQMGFPKSQWKSIRTSNAIERLHEEFKRRIKTLIVLRSAETAA
jgi:Transposase, Mutator family